jgi:hypothetical protein
MPVDDKAILNVSVRQGQKSKTAQAVGLGELVILSGVAGDRNRLNLCSEPI